jgi:hypothetical protein
VAHRRVALGEYVLGGPGPGDGRALGGARLGHVLGVGRRLGHGDAEAAVTLKLNSTGRALLKAGHGRLGARLVLVKSSPTPAATLNKSVHLLLKSKKR